MNHMKSSGRFVRHIKANSHGTICIVTTCRMTRGDNLVSLTQLTKVGAIFAFTRAISADKLLLQIVSCELALMPFVY